MDERGLEDPSWWRGRQHEYLSFATKVWIPASPLNVVAHFAFARHEPGHRIDQNSIDDAVLDGWFTRIDHWLDCADFDVLRLLTLWFEAGDRLDERVRSALAQRFVAFRYWFSDPVAIDATDERWYWSENHRLIFHTCEYLAGQALPDDRFGVTNMTGAQHRRRAEQRLHAWFDEKSVDGFSEWHSDVYYAKDLAPLVTLAEFSLDAALAERAATFCDLVLYDLALHQFRGNVGVTHGRSYMKDKSRAVDQPVFGATKLCFATTSEPWPAGAAAGVGVDGERTDGFAEAELRALDESAVLLARTQLYRPPAILRRVATCDAEMVDHESMGIVIDPSEALVDEPVRADGLSYTDPELVAFWWDRGALTPWQLVSLTIATLDAHDLWDSELFAMFSFMRDALGADPELWRTVAADLHLLVNAGLLSKVCTTTWRNAHAMLSTAQAYRPGAVGFQHHSWQATLDERAVVFATHPGNPPAPNSGAYLDSDRYWTGSATLPRAVQYRRVGICAFEPGFAMPDTDVLAAFGYEPYTHAYFPTEFFDEVRRDGHWTMARRRDGYVALWSWRRPEWRHHDAADTFTGGLSGEYDLVAHGGADNVWIVEVGDVDASGTFDAFCAGVVAAEVRVDRPDRPADEPDRPADEPAWAADESGRPTDGPAWAADGPHPGLAVRYASPSAGTVESSPDVLLRVEGEEIQLDHDRRFDNPWTHVARGDTTVTIRDDEDAWTLDLANGTRHPVHPHPVHHHPHHECRGEK